MCCKVESHDQLEERVDARLPDLPVAGYAANREISFSHEKSDETLKSRTMAARWLTTKIDVLAVS